ncbi:hypothetical protein OIU77_001100, partial [Salix suchowensis]
MMIKSITGFSGCCLVPSPFHHTPAYMGKFVSGIKNNLFRECEEGLHYELSKSWESLEALNRQVPSELLNFSYENYMGVAFIK